MAVDIDSIYGQLYSVVEDSIGTSLPSAARGGLNIFRSTELRGLEASNRPRPPFVVFDLTAIRDRGSEFPDYMYIDEDAETVATWKPETMVMSVIVHGADSLILAKAIKTYMALPNTLGEFSANTSGAEITDVDSITYSPEVVSARFSEASSFRVDISVHDIYEYTPTDGFIEDVDLDGEVVAASENTYSASIDTTDS